MLGVPTKILALGINHKLGSKCRKSNSPCWTLVVRARNRAIVQHCMSFIERANENVRPQSVGGRL